MPQYLLDTNVVVRFLMGEPREQANASARLVARSDRGEVSLLLPAAVFAECVFVLESYYGRSKKAIAQSLMTFIQGPGIEVPEMKLLIDALKRYAEKNLSFIDAYLAAASADRNIPVASFDSDFRKFDDVKAYSPLSMP
jgi:predicted nucleic acid-binding protein